MGIKINTKSIEQYKMIFKKTLGQFEKCLENFKNLSEDDKKLADKIIQDWKSRLNDDNWLQKFVCIKNFQTILEFKNELSYKLSFPDLIDKVAQHFGEIDCAIHILREFPQEIEIEKLLEQNNSSVCDFKIYTLIPHLVEVKTVKKFIEPRINKYTHKALKQIEKSGNNNRYHGVVWIFTYDIPKDLTYAQTIIERIKSSIQKSFKYTLTVQVYSLGLWGDSTLMVNGLPEIWAKTGGQKGKGF